MLHSVFVIIFVQYKLYQEAWVGLIVKFSFLRMFEKKTEQMSL